MDGSRLLILILILIVAGVIGGTFIVEAIRKKDFGDQVSGKKPEHKLGKNQKISYDKPAQENSPNKKWTEYPRTQVTKLT